jgi:hypothetical protein
LNGCSSGEAVIVGTSLVPSSDSKQMEHWPGRPLARSGAKREWQCGQRSVSGDL